MTKKDQIESQPDDKAIDETSDVDQGFTIGHDYDFNEYQGNLLYINDDKNSFNQRQGYELYDDEDDDDLDYDPNKKVIVGICAMEKKAQSKPMKEILKRLEDYFEYISPLVFEESTILNKPIEEWPLCDCLISFHSKGFPLSKAIEYARLRKPFLINDLDIQYDIQDRRKVYKLLEDADIELPRYVVLDRDSANPEERELVEGDDHIEIGNCTFNKPFVEKPISAEDHNICIYYPAHAGGGSQRLFRKIGCRSSVYSNESRVRKTGSYIYEEFMPTDGTDVKVYTAGPDYAHAEARKSPALDGKVERDIDGKEIRYPVILTNREKLIARKVCLAFKQTVCGFDLLRANGKSYVCDVNGFSFVKSSMKYYEDCSKILGNMMLRALAPRLHIPWSIPFQLDDPPIVPTTFGRMMELRCVIAVIRHGDRTPKQKMKLEVKHAKFFELYQKYGNPKSGQAKLKKPRQLQEVLDIARYLLGELHDQPLNGEVMEPRIKLRQLKSVLEMYGHFSGINRKVQLKYQPHGRPRRSSSEEESAKEPSLVLILKWGGELTPAGRVQAEDLGRCFRRLYPASGDYSGPQGLGLLRLHSTFRHDLKIYASDEGRVQMTAAAFAKGFLALEGELTPILFQMVKSANTNGLLDDDYESSKCQKTVKEKLHEIMHKDRDLAVEDIEILNPTHAPSIDAACKFIGNPYQACEKVHKLIKDLNALIKSKRQDSGFTQEYHLYHGETWDLLQRRWAKLEKDFKFPRTKRFDISKIPDIYDCIKYDLQHNQHTLQFVFAHELYTYAKALADIVIPQEYGMTSQEKMMISLGTCSPLLRKIQSDLLRNADSSNDDESESVNRLDPKYSHGVSSPDRHVRTRLYFTSESHIHSLVTALQFGGLLDVKKDEQWKRSMEFLSAISELNYLSQIVIMLYEDPTKDPTSDDRFHVEIHFSSGVINRINQNQNLPTEPQGPGFRPHVNTNKNYIGSYSAKNDAEHQNDLELSFRAKLVTSKQGTDTMIREEPIDEERSVESDSRGNSKGSSAIVTPSRMPLATIASEDSVSRQSDTSSAGVVEDRVGGSVEFRYPTNSQGNSRQGSAKSRNKSLSRSYSAVTPTSLKGLFGEEVSSIESQAESKQLVPGESTPLAAESFTLTCSKLKSKTNVDIFEGEVHELYRKADSDELRSESLTPTIKNSLRSGWKHYEDQLVSDFKSLHNTQGPRRRHLSGHGASDHLLPPSYHTIHHCNFSPTVLTSKLGSSASMSTSPQQAGNSNLQQRYLASKQQQLNRQYFTMSASMPIHHRNNHNPRACSVADVSQYCAGPSSLISTAVISGSSPDLAPMCPYSPNIRPLETLHNELSLKKFNDFIVGLTRNHRSQAISSELSRCKACGFDGSTGSRHAESKCNQDHSLMIYSGTNLNSSSSRFDNRPFSDRSMTDLSQDSQMTSGPRDGTNPGCTNSSNNHCGFPLGLSPGNSLSNSLIWSNPPSSHASSPRPSSPSGALELWSKLEQVDGLIAAANGEKANNSNLTQSESSSNLKSSSS